MLLVRSFAAGCAADEPWGRHPFVIGAYGLGAGGGSHETMFLSSTSSSAYSYFFLGRLHHLQSLLRVFMFMKMVLAMFENGFWPCLKMVVAMLEEL